MFKPNVPIIDVFVEENLITGLNITNFSVTLLFNGVLSLVPVTLNEVAGKPGFYRVEFTPNANGQWVLDVIRIGNQNVRYQSSYRVLEISSEILDEPVAPHLNPGSVGDYINRVKKYTANRIVLDALGGTYEVKEDDGVTTFEDGLSTPTERTPN